MEEEEQSAPDLSTEHQGSDPTPRTHVDSKPLPTDSLVTISLSDVNRMSSSTTCLDNTILSAPEADLCDEPQQRSSIDIINGLHNYEEGEESLVTTPVDNVQSPDWIRSSSPSFPTSHRSNGNSLNSREGSDRSIDVDWEELDKTEEREDADAENDEATALLLARLEQENNAIASDPKSRQSNPKNSKSRPPSVYQLRKMAQEQGPRSVRFSLLPSAAPMTEMDFWTALVQDYRNTAQRLPTLTTNKIRSGVPLPLRGVVWVSTAGARDPHLSEQFEKLSTESSPYETIINKDIGRSFPGVEMFKDPEGEGQQMLARVLKCYSLHDQQIGYCQGLGFLVGPLLMNMGDKEAFCVLVRLMEDYDLRSCFLPDLSGLHLRIYQFQKLLHQHVPILAAHLDRLQVEGAYLSQWFLSFFAITCPLPLLFRIYDVIFVEGASETIMRVALAVMQRNEKRLLAFTEFEDAMQLLLSRALWDPYGMNAMSAGELVNDFCSFTGVVTRESLQELETSFREAQKTGTTGALSFLPSVQQAASRFLRRGIWGSGPSHASSKSQTTLSPVSAGQSNGSSRPVSGSLLRTPSKQSLMTLYSAEGSSDGSISTASTAMTEISIASRESTADLASIKSVKSTTEADRSTKGTLSTKDKDLHQQVEDLLMVLSEMQREHAVLTAQLQREREERNEDNLVVGKLVDQLKKEMGGQTPKAERRKTASDVALIHQQLSDKVRQMVDSVQDRVTPKAHSRKSSNYETKAQLRNNLASLKEQLHNEATRAQDLSRELSEKEIEAASAKDELAKARARIKDGHLQQQRLEKTILELRHAQRQRSSSSQTSASNSGASTPDDASPPPLFRTDTAPADTGPAKGLREFKLVRTLSDRQKQAHSALSAGSAAGFSKRSSSLMATAALLPEHADDTTEALLQELVAAKTNEALARQELEEERARFEAMRRAMVLSTGASAPLGVVDAAPPALPADDDAPPLKVQPVAFTADGDRRSPESAAASAKSAASWSGVTSSLWSWGARRAGGSAHAAGAD